jgi:hypothetical protein
MTTPENTSKGYYFGTEVDGRWWKRYRGKAFFARGNGEFWFDEQGLHFRKLLTTTPLSIPFSEMKGVRLGRWHAGKWGGGRPVLKIDFGRSGEALTAGFLLAKEWDRMESFASDLRAKIGTSGS